MATQLINRVLPLGSIKMAFEAAIEKVEQLLRFF